MKTLRQIQLYPGICFAPAIIFSALSGAVPTLGLHEEARDGSYRVPAWLNPLAVTHKDQRLEHAVEIAFPSPGPNHSGVRRPGRGPHHCP